MGFLYRIHDGMQLFLPGLVYRVVLVDPGHRYVGGDLDNVHPVNITELFFFRKGRTCHAGLFLKFIKKVLESNGR